MTTRDCDELDKRIISMLSRSSQESYRQMAKRLDIHPNTLMQRVKNLEDRGIIRGYRAYLDYMKLGFDYMGVINIYAEDVGAVSEHIKNVPQVVSVFYITGESDIIALVACMGRDEFSEVVRSINSIPKVKKTSTAVVLNIIKDPFSFIPPIVDDSDGRPSQDAAPAGQEPGPGM